MNLSYREDGTFRIVQLTDLHIGSYPFHEDDEKTFELVRKALNNLDADLVVVTGDNIWSEGVPEPEKGFQTLIDLFNEFPVPITLTYGNHDSEESVTRSDLRKMEEKLRYRVTKKHSFIVDDRESYVVEIADREEGEVKNALYIFDSGADAPLPIGTYDWILPEQVNWFNDTSKFYKRASVEKTDLAFLHIPLPEYRNAANAITDGYHYETNEPISAPHLNTGLFASMVFNGQVSAVFCGHDHDNNFAGEFAGIQLVYGNTSGYQCYGDFITKGARVIELSPESKMKTYTVAVDDF